MSCKLHTSWVACKDGPPMMSSKCKQILREVHLLVNSIEHMTENGTVNFLSLDVAVSASENFTSRSAVSYVV